MKRSLPDFDAWAIFATVASAGSFARAGKDLGLSKASISKAVSRLEHRLKVQLFYRTTRRLSLTEAGRDMLQRAEQILLSGEAAESAALAHSQVPSGRVRMALPMSFGLKELSPLLPQLLAQYPELSLDLHLSDETIDLLDGGFDLALRIGALADSTLRTRRICEIRRMVVGSPGYFQREGRPEDPTALADHSCLDYSYLPGSGRWDFRNAAGEEVSVRPKGPIRANNAEALTPALLAGLGVAVQPEFVVWRELAEGTLVEVLSDWSLPVIALNIVAPPGALRPPRVQAVIDFLVTKLGSAPWSMGSPS